MTENTLTIDLTKFEAVLNALPEKVERAVMREAKKQLTDVQRVARVAHRFQSTSGLRPAWGRKKAGYYKNTHKLEKSVQVEMTGDGGRVYLDTGVADYGPYVHEGQRSWEPDRFVYQALAIQRHEIINGIGRAVAEAINSL